MTVLHSLIASVMLLLLTACVSPHDDRRIAPAQVPYDFTLQFAVRGKATTMDPLEQSAQYLVQPDRAFRAALGVGATAEYFPPLTRRLSVDQQTAVFHAISDRNLQAEPTSPRAKQLLLEPDSTATLYQVEIIAFGRRYKFATTPGESPPVRDLLTLLTSFTGNRTLPPPASQPAP